MKRSTCNMLIGFGILLLIPSILYLLIGGSVGGLGFIIPAIILFIIAGTKYNSEREFKSLKQRAQVQVHTKTRFKDLK